MNPDLWNRIEELYYSALELEAGDRESFLEHQCQEDESLKHEVLSLLAAADRQDSFMDEPAASLALEVLRSERMGLVGETIARYQIIDALGDGGMGEVYLAHDPSLNRKVALKILPATITDNHLRVLRFQQEARAASAIAHPNVAHIYEIGEANGFHYITMEYVRGATLRELLKNKVLDATRSLEVAKQVCDALAAAHKAGVIHRDIKPENVVVTDNGHVKVLDFGLATLIEGVPEFHDTSTSHTQPELLMGTLQYMSPEQIRRHPVDHRTDLWSLGVVLFELILHRRPFAGETTAEVIATILEREPDSSVNSELGSPEVGSVWLKALKKDPDLRYQSAEEMLHDLRQISARTINENSGARRLWLLMPLFLIATAAFYYSYKTSYRTTLLNRAFNLRSERLHISGDITEIVISPDGKHVAYGKVEAGKHSIYVRELATASELRVSAVSDSSYSGLSFSPDGTFVYYLENQAETGTLYRVSKLGGGPRLIMENVNTAVTFSPDGSQMAFVRRNALGPADLVMAPAHGGSSSVLVRRTFADTRFFASHLQGPGPAWSPDGKSIACVTHGLGAKFIEVSLEMIDVKSGTARPVKAGPWHHISRISWLHDGSGMIVAATDKPNDAGQLYLVGNGVTRQITQDPKNYTLVSGSSDSSVFVTRHVERSSRFWQVSPVKSPATTINVEHISGLGEVEFATDGKFIYSVFDGTNTNLWLQEGSERRQLTFEGDNSRPTISPNGRYIVFRSTRSGGVNIWRMNSDGTQPLQLTTGLYPGLLSVTADSKWVIYRSGPKVCRVSIDGGPEETLLNRGVEGPSLSPDGRLLAFFVSEQPDSQVRHIEIYDLTTRAITMILHTPDSTRPYNGMSFKPDSRLRWTPDGKALAYISRSSGVSNIWIQTLSDGQSRRLTDFRDGEIRSFAWSADGQEIVLVRETRTYAPVLVRLF